MQDPNNFTLATPGRGLRRISGWTFIASFVLGTAFWAVVPFLSPMYGLPVDLTRTLGQDPIQTKILEAGSEVFTCVVIAASVLGIIGIVAGFVAGRRGSNDGN